MKKVATLSPPVAVAHGGRLSRRTVVRTLLLFVAPWLLASRSPAAFQAGSLQSATGPASITVGQPLTLTVTVENTGQPFLGVQPPDWYFYGALPSWIASIEKVSWDTNAPSYEFDNYDWVFPGAQDTFDFTLSDANLPTAPGNYAVLVNCFFPYENDGLIETYLRMDNSPKVVYFAIVNGPPVILAQPQSQTVAEGADAAFTVKAGGTLKMNYQWRFNGIPLPGATNSNLTLTQVTTSAAGTYTVKISNTLGQALSDKALLTVDVPPQITAPPTGQIVRLGDRVSFEVNASGSLPLTYQWHLNGTDLADGTNAAWTIAGVQGADAGEYSVSVGNIAGAVTSPPAALTIRALLTAVSTSSPNAFQMSLQGGIGEAYLLQASVDLSTWISLATVTNTGGVITFQDPSVTNYVKRFYRAVAQQ